MSEQFGGRIGKTVPESEPWWAPRPAAPENAPNVVLVVFDDTGFAQLGCYGSDIETPNINRIASEGLRFTNFHTTALCSPTRASLLSGRNHHSVGMRFLSNVDTGFSNCRGVITPRAATVAEVLQMHGYSTLALGKWHLANMEDSAPAGPMNHWPLGRGFDRFYGFMGGATDQFSPELAIDNHPVDPPSDPGYHLSEAMIDQAIDMITGIRATSAKPFFSYVAFGATHSPHQAPAEFIEKYRGRYDAGWDVIRAQWFERQKTLGVIPASAELSPRNEGIPAWDDLSPDEQRLFARMQEVFAGFLDHTDVQIGRLYNFIEQIGELDNTIFIVMSDNGASQEGGRDGVINEITFFNRMRTHAKDMIAHIDEIGGPNLYNNYPRGWAQVGNCPLRYYKQNTYEGGIRDPFIIRWPARIKATGEIRDQYHHAIDVMPTLLECIGLTAPTSYKGIDQMPLEGMSMAYAFGDAKAPSVRKTQYYEMLGHRAIYHDGWKAVTRHRPGSSFDDDVWHLYHVAEDFAEIHDLAEVHPDKLAEMKERWWTEAGRYNVLPLDDRSTELFAMRRPGSELDRNLFRFLPGTPHVERFALPDIRNRSFAITASATIDAGSQGVLVAAGARTGGYCLYLLDGKFCFTYNYAAQQYTHVRSSAPLPVGEVSLSARFEKQGDNTGKLLLLVNGSQVAESPLSLLPWRQTLYGLDIGRDCGSSVTAEYMPPFPFTGRLEAVTFELQNDRDDLQRAAQIESQNLLIDQ
ncbi:MAG: arylsulfatase [Pseudomonadota bacterium]